MRGLGEGSEIGRPVPSHHAARYGDVWRMLQWEYKCRSFGHMAEQQHDWFPLWCKTNPIPFLQRLAIASSMVSNGSSRHDWFLKAMQDEPTSLPTEISYNFKHKTRNGYRVQSWYGWRLWRFSAADEYIASCTFRNTRTSGFKVYNTLKPIYLPLLYVLS